MTIKNKYVNRSKISEAKFRELIRYFVADLSATKMSYLSSLNRNTVNRYLLEIRKKIALYCELDSPFLGDVELDESYFGPIELGAKEVVELMAKP